MSSGIWSVAATKFGFWIWIWSTRQCGLEHEGLVHFNAGKTQRVSFDRSNNTGAIDVKKDGSVLGEKDGTVFEEKSSFIMLALHFCFRLDWGSYITSIAKTVSKKIGVLICSIKIFLLRLLCISIILRYSHAWNSFFISGLLLLVNTWNC